MKLPVLMYHKVSRAEIPERLNVSPEQLESQFRYLSENGFQSISIRELIEHIYEGKKIQKRAILITFDDGYNSHFSNVYPLLLRYNLKATIFLTAAFVQTNENTSEREYLHIKEILTMQRDRVEYGLHTMDHKSYNDLSTTEIEDDIEKTLQLFAKLDIPVEPCFAYTYGAFPRKDPRKREELFKIFEKKGIRLAFPNW